MHLVFILEITVASFFGEFKDNFSLMMDFITIGRTAGLSGAFNAPIGIVLLAFKEAVSFFPNHVLSGSFFTSAFAELTLKEMNLFYNGNTVLFEIDNGLTWHFFDLTTFFVAGCIGGLIGSFFIHFNVKYFKVRIQKGFIKRRHIVELLIITLFTVVMGCPMPFLRYANTQILTSFFVQCPVY